MTKRMFHQHITGERGVGKASFQTIPTNGKIRRRHTLKEVFRQWQIRFFCTKEKHQWEYCTWGNAMVDNLDATFSMWEIATRACTRCKRQEFNLKNGWEKARKGLTIEDLK